MNNIDAIEAGFSPLESYSVNEHIDELQTQDNIVGHVDRYKKCKEYIDKYYINKDYSLTSDMVQQLNKIDSLCQQL